MTSLELAQLLVDSDADQREVRWRGNGSVSPVEIAEQLQRMCYEAWTEDPQRVSMIADTLQFMAAATGDIAVQGFTEWAVGIRNIVAGELTTAIENIDCSESTFSRLGKIHLAAKTQTSKLYCLALLGRYEEAIKTGENALRVFVEHGDLYSAGKIEHNIGNLYWRRDMYREAEPYLESARLQFVEIDDQRQIAMVENCQAFVKTLQNQFRSAEILYKQALDRAQTNDLTVTEAEIETGLSNLYLFESKYDLALKFMERSRQKYEQLEMPNHSAMCELEIADIYLELNLLPEAVDFYEKVGGRLADLGMQAELARCSLSHARAMIRLNDEGKAMRLLDKAESLYRSEGNAIAAASVRLSRAQLFFDKRDLDNARDQVDLALTVFEESPNVRLHLFASWLRAEITYLTGGREQAVTEFEATLELAKDQAKDVEYLCLRSLGKILESEDHLGSAINLVEGSRARLSLEELRTSYFADKIEPYDDLIKIKLKKGLFQNAFLLHERSRARSLAEQLDQPQSTCPSDERLSQMREELNWYYRRINRSSFLGSDERKRIEKLRAKAREREREYSELERRLAITAKRDVEKRSEIEIEEFRLNLDRTTVVEFASIDGSISAFVISKDDFTALPNYADETALNNEIKHFLFQIKTGRFLDRLSDANRAAALERLLVHSRRIYDSLLRPLESLVKTERIVFAPSGLMHYLPFHALHTGSEYMIERAEISYTPSVAVLDHCLKKRPPRLDRALIVGNPDEFTPMIAAEIETVAELFAASTVLSGAQATIENIRNKAAGADLVHLACHGKFRPDNPGFSSLSLYSEELTVNEVRNLPLDNCILILSACETGLNEVVRGEELIGLTRAFFAAGAGTLMLSLWRVDDKATLELITSLYNGLNAGKGLAGSLRNAQRQMIAAEIHPYFWSPFMISGRW